MSLPKKEYGFSRSFSEVAVEAATGAALEAVQAALEASLEEAEASRAAVLQENFENRYNFLTSKKIGCIIIRYL